MSVAMSPSVPLFLPLGLDLLWWVKITRMGEEEEAALKAKQEDESLRGIWAQQ